MSIIAVGGIQGGQCQSVITSVIFETAPNCTVVPSYALRNTEGALAAITNYSGALTKLFVSAQERNLGTAPCGLDGLASYARPSNRYFGDTTRNFLKGKLRDIGSVTAGQHYGFARETQHFSDSDNQLAFPSTVLRPSETFCSSTKCRFNVRQQPRYHT
ncbi:hypothetical protein [Hymenobacter crusticola]|uniref:Uncharacterized protein n=1 Tax=Hymenobacter crusticola TaxID=1770526 RepID=A0A243WDU2_9BACT|nr:hypothetical protein [Hymenobacter crusticola]OUJ73823.1 hypothetical protein BXP70_12670 [Hymenobacter crusticola]